MNDQDALLLLWVISALVVVVAIHRFGTLPWLRKRRLAPVLAELLRAEDARPRLGYTPGQQSLNEVLEELARTERAAVAAQEQAKALPVPVPDGPSPGEDQRQVLSRLAQILDDNRVAVGVAGGEQAIMSLIANPGALEHLAHAANVLPVGHALVLAANIHEAGLVHGLVHGSAEVVKDVFIDHGLQGVGDLPGNLADGLQDAGHHVSEAFDAGSAGGFHFPVVTLLLSTVREGALVLDDKTSIERALAHVAVDTGATAAGGFGGMKAGALFGAVFGPAGAAVGAVVGAIAGAAGGRYVAKEVRFAPLHKAVGELKSVHQRAEKEMTASAHAAAQRVHDCGTASRAEYLSGINEAPAPPRLVAACPQLQKLAGDLRMAMSWQVEEATRDVSEATSLALARMPTTSWYHVALGLDIRADAAARVEAVRGETASILANCAFRLSTLSGQANALTLLRELARTPVPVGGRVERVLNETASEARRFVQYCVDQRGRWSIQVARNYQHAVRSVADTLQIEAERHRSAFEQWKQTLEHHRAEVDRHRAALGLT